MAQAKVAWPSQYCGREDTGTDTSSRTGMETQRCGKLRSPVVKRLQTNTASNSRLCTNLLTRTDKFGQCIADLITAGLMVKFPPSCPSSHCSSQELHLLRLRSSLSPPPSPPHHPPYHHLHSPTTLPHPFRRPPPPPPDVRLWCCANEANSHVAEFSQWEVRLRDNRLPRT
ncbi:unnamed protein product [Protopolystoma xenopodis]|uniref:Uncharacterized protein n=1 Tax=Protopolystoma xenopodis TaxID=117903 RepID=A0A448X1H1_9PLAT|nr:unnamed protein product [Protopolystoma xenopodis]